MPKTVPGIATLVALILCAAALVVAFGVPSPRANETAAQDAPAHTSSYADTTEGAGSSSAPGTDAPTAETAAAAAPRPDTSAVVATVNGEPVTEEDLRLEAINQGIITSSESLPNEREIRDTLTYDLIDQRLLAAAARKAGVHEEPHIRRRFEMAQERVLAQEFFGRAVQERITDQAVRDFYDKEVAGAPEREEFRASHILLRTEDEAKAVLAELEGGADFAALAKEKSEDKGSGNNGGDLGWFRLEEMVPEFSQQVASLEPGEVGGPVQSRFGFHVVRLDEKRVEPKPAFEEVEPQIRRFLATQVAEEIMKNLRTGAKIHLEKGAEGSPYSPHGSAPQGAE